MIGIVSDTHGFMHPALVEVMTGVDVILHAGDVGRIEIIDELQLVAPVHAVSGNIDGWEIRASHPVELTVTVAGVTFWMTHIGGRPGRWAPGIKEELIARTPDIFVCGHSHILKVERTDRPRKVLFINPGAAGRQGLHQVKTCLRLTIENAKPSKVDVIHLDKL
ncbi:MAG: metallophosphoesterase [Rhodothermia bacterium]